LPAASFSRLEQRRQGDELFYRVLVDDVRWILMLSLTVVLDVAGHIYDRIG